MGLCIIFIWLYALGIEMITLLIFDGMASCPAYVYLYACLVDIILGLIAMALHVWLAFLFNMAGVFIIMARLLCGLRIVLLLRWPCVSL